MRTSVASTLLLALGLGLNAFPGCSWDSITGTEAAGGEHSVTIQRSAAAAGLSAVSVESENGSIELRGEPRETIEIVVRQQVRAETAAAAAAFAAQIDVHVERDGDQLLIYHTHPRPPAEVQVTMDYGVRCPPALTVQAVTVNGGIAAQGMQGGATAVTVNGDIEYDGAAGPVSLVTVNGGVRAALTAVAAGASLTTVNGSIRLDVHSGQGTLQAEAHNGNITARLHQGFNGELDARTDNGAIHSDIALGDISVSTTRLTGRIGRGGSADVGLRAHNGNIELRRL